MVQRKIEQPQTYDVVAIGVSAGGIKALECILPRLLKGFHASVVVVQHIAEGAGSYIIEHFAERCTLAVKEATDKAMVEQGVIYFAPPGYHLLVETDCSFALSVDAKLNYSRPSIDILFETVAEAYCEKAVGVVLTGANNDGVAGLSRIKALGGLTVVQSPETAEVATMPRAAIGQIRVDHILPLEEISQLLNQLDLGQ